MRVRINLNLRLSNDGNRTRKLLIAVRCSTGGYGLWQSEGHGFDSRQELSSFSEIRLDRHTYSKF